MSTMMRPLEAFPIETQEGLRVMIRDPIGVIPEPLVLSPELYWIACQLDGSDDPVALARRMQPDTGQVSPDLIREALSALDEHLLLDNARFHAARDQLRAAFRAQSVRHAQHSAGNYPGEPEACRHFLGSLLAEEGREQGHLPEPLRGVIAPHIDIERGRPTYARTYGPLARLAQPPRRIVALGTCHAPMEGPIGLTRKAFETPLGALECDVPAVEELAATMPGDPYRDEFCQRNEHSIEFQALFLKYLFPEARLVPILVGSLLDPADPERAPEGRSIARFAAALRALGGPETLFVAGVDLAHVGPRFGNPPSLDRAYLEWLEGADRSSLSLACAGDAEGFWSSVAAGGDPRQVCGLAPIYLFLEALRSTSATHGTLVQYRQCVADDQCVSIAGLWFQ